MCAHGMRGSAVIRGTVRHKAHSHDESSRYSQRWRPVMLTLNSAGELVSLAKSM